MSGICALLDRGEGPRGAGPAESRLRAMLDRLAQRGPDGMGLALDGPCALGQALLVTTVEEQSLRQPIRGAGDRLLIAADARIDNREELFSFGAGAGRPCAEVSDAELLLWAYERWGERCPERVVGDFAFVLWDRAKGQLFAARDPIGVRPLFYYADTHEFRCASEMHALFADGRLERRAHRLSLGLFLAWQYEESHQTLYRNVFALPPAHSLTVTARALRLRRYWEPDGWRVIRHQSDESHAEHFRAVLTEAVRSRLRARGPIAAEVSGGLDSSSVVGLAEELRRAGRCPGPPVNLVTMRYTEWPGCDESEWADAVAAYWGLPMIAISACGSPERRAPVLANLPPDFYYDAGVLDGAREFERCRSLDMRVILTGVGGDEILRHTGHEVPSALRAGRIGAALRLAGIGALPSQPERWAALLRAVPSAVAPDLRRRIRWRLGRPSGLVPSWLEPTVAHEVEQLLAARRAERASRRYRDRSMRSRCEHIAFGGQLFPNLGRLEILAAYHGVELRHPFLDRRVVEHLLALPDEQRAGLGQNKPVLRRALGAGLPPAILGRQTTQETSCYYERAFLYDHQTPIRRLLESSRLERAAIIRGGPVRSMLDSPAEFVHHLHTIIALELWLRQSIPDA